MRKMWAVSTGSYSDYNMLTIFERKDDAERFSKIYGRFSLNKWNDTRESLGDQLEAGVVTAEEEEEGAYWPTDDARVEEILVYGPGELPKPIITYFVEVDRNGNEVKRWSEADWPWWSDSKHGVNDLEDRVRAWSVRGYEAALKAARDKLYRQKARSAGVAD